MEFPDWSPIRGSKPSHANLRRYLCTYLTYLGNPACAVPRTVYNQAKRTTVRSTTLTFQKGT